MKVSRRAFLAFAPAAVAATYVAPRMARASEPAAKEIATPNPWRRCDGSALSKTEFRDLYSAIGTTYGGTSTTFNLPNNPRLLIRTVSAELPAGWVYEEILMT